MGKAFMQPLEEAAGFREVRDRLPGLKGMLSLSGCLDSQKAHLAWGLSQTAPATLLITEDEQGAAELFDDYRVYGGEVLYYPARDLIFYQADLAGNLLTEQRMKVIQALHQQKKVTVITSAGGVMDRLLPFGVLENYILTIRDTDELDPVVFSEKLAEMGYERCGQVEGKGQFAVRGGIIDIFDLTEENPWRIELWGDEIDSIRSFDVESQRSLERVETITLYPATEEPGTEEAREDPQRFSYTFPEYFPEGTLLLLDEPARLLEKANQLYGGYKVFLDRKEEKGKTVQGMENRMLSPEELQMFWGSRPCVALSLLDLNPRDFELQYAAQIMCKSVGPYNNQYPMLLKDLQRWKKDKSRVILLSASRTRGRRLAEELQAEGLNAFFSESEERVLQGSELMVTCGSIRRGFSYPLQKFVIISESDVFGQRKKRRKKKNYNGQVIRSFQELAVGDYVVHENYGLGIYRGLEAVEVENTVKDYLKIEYAGGSNLFVQASHLEVLQKYASSEAKAPRLNKLGSPEWKKTRTRVRREVAGIARELVQLYAARERSTGYAYEPDTIWQKEFEEMFPFDETEDQLDAIRATKEDMESSRIMDRLICGDVGFGKTEVAIRAAFKAVQESKQVVVLVPTTILAQQHYNTFVERMKDFPVKIEMLCRFRSAYQQKKIIEDLRKGNLDIVIGTHRVLSDKIIFKDLGLLVIDEEQRFGVTHKEKIKQLKKTVDVLTLTATPIPRTLHMSLIGIRDMSLLEEAPVDRLPIQTFVMEYDEDMVREALRRELDRNGQVYYVYNRVNTIAEITNKIQELVPDAVVAFAHGQMKERELEQIMIDFINGEIDVLVSTTIIETGMDISNVNTIIIHDAERLGLSQLYQLRGRVGRSGRTAYAYLLYRRDRMLKEEAEKRLHAIREYTDLGSGVKIAMRDLEIRGAGNLLGAEQHGHIDAVGYDLYCKMLTEAVQEAQGLEVKEDFETVIDLYIDAHLPASYVSNEGQKLDLYKRIASIETSQEADEIRDELIDRFGEPPRSVELLLEAAELKAAAHRVYITEMKQSGSLIRISLYEKADLDVSRFAELISRFAGQLTLRAESVPYFVYQLAPGKGKSGKNGLLLQLKNVTDAMEELLLSKEQVP